jgi:hypothetical protein
LDFRRKKEGKKDDSNVATNVTYDVVSSLSFTSRKHGKKEP